MYRSKTETETDSGILSVELDICRPHRMSNICSVFQYNWRQAPLVSVANKIDDRALDGQKELRTYRLLIKPVIAVH